MSTYTVTIGPDPAASGGSLCVVVRVDTGAPRPRVIEMSVRTSAPEGLITAQLPDIDLQGIVDALRSGIRSGTGPSAVQSQPVKSAQAARGSARSKGERPRKNPQHQGSPSYAAIDNLGSVQAGRAYRRMPEASELVAVHQRVGTVTGVAKHYDVPRHTAQGWMTRLRKLQLIDVQREIEPSSPSSGES